jgi:hypothetical protein
VHQFASPGESACICRSLLLIGSQFNAADINGKPAKPRRIVRMIAK